MQIGLARFRESESSEGEEGNDQQGGKPRDQVEQQASTLSRALVGRARWRRHGDRVTVTAQSVPRLCPAGKLTDGNGFSE
jgi:hypothetical protein